MDIQPLLPQPQTSALQSTANKSNTVSVLDQSAGLLPSTPPVWILWPQERLIFPRNIISESYKGLEKKMNWSPTKEKGALDCLASGLEEDKEMYREQLWRKCMLMFRCKGLKESCQSSGYIKSPLSDCLQATGQKTMRTILQDEGGNGLAIC